MCVCVHMCVSLGLYSLKRRLKTLGMGPLETFGGLGRCWFTGCGEKVPGPWVPGKADGASGRAGEASGMLWGEVVL